MAKETFATLPVLVNVLARVIAEDQGVVVVDLAEADFFDTASARVVGRAAEYLGTRGRLLTIRSASRQAVMVLTAFGLSYLLEGEAHGDIEADAENLGSEPRSPGDLATASDAEHVRDRK